ncbi:MAG: DUF2062 domain-containing protein [Candidatus Omnitrophica bacterium]|nr:DUF2062 domain-containing protein [Candidatus Omnitrophota bacterium]
MIANLRGRLKALWNFKEPPHRLAFAFSLGVFLGVMPGTGAIAAGACAAFLKLNVPVAVAGALVSNNPLTTVLIYTAGYALGQSVLGEYLPDSNAAQISLATIFGMALLAIVMGAAAYLPAFVIAWAAQRRRNAKGKAKRM